VNDDPLFLTVGDVLSLHSDQIRQFGGSEGLRDEGGLASAVAQASATYGGKYLHSGPFEMAAAYAFHIAANHPFLDGNERTR
jgi:death-on-curing protein